MIEVTLKRIRRKLVEAQHEFGYKPEEEEEIFIAVKNLKRLVDKKIGESKPKQPIFPITDEAIAELSEKDLFDLAAKINELRKKISKALIVKEVEGVLVIKQTRCEKAITQECNIEICAHHASHEVRPDCMKEGKCREFTKAVCINKIP